MYWYNDAILGKELMHEHAKGVLWHLKASGIWWAKTNSTTNYWPHPLDKVHKVTQWVWSS